MKIIKVPDEAMQLHEMTGKPYHDMAKELWSGYQKQYPVDLGSVQKVAYDSKTDRYVATFGVDKVLALKTSNEAAQFLAEHLRESGTWLGAIEDGVLTDVVLLQV